MYLETIRTETISRLKDQAASQPLQVRQTLQKLLSDLRDLDPQEAKSFQEDPRVQYLMAHLALP